MFAVTMFLKWNMKTFGDFDGLALFVRIVQAGGLASRQVSRRPRSRVGCQRWKRP